MFQVFIENDIIYKNIYGIEDKIFLLVVIIIHIVTAKRYCCKDGGWVVRLHIVAVHRGAGVAGERLRSISTTAGRAYESRYAAAQ